MNGNPLIQQPFGIYGPYGTTPNGLGGSFGGGLGLGSFGK
jgi:hypothetical protein